MTTDQKKEYATKIIQRILIIVGVLVVILVIFQAGMFVGYRKASFSYSMGDRYYRTFDEPGRGYFGQFDKDLPEANGAVGSIVRISLPTFVVATPDNIEKIIRINDDTIIRQFRNVATASDLKVGDKVVALGNPNGQAEIEAKLIRILPAPPPTTPTQATSTQ